MIIYILNNYEVKNKKVLKLRTNIEGKSKCIDHGTLIYENTTNIWVIIKKGSIIPYTHTHKKN